MTQHINLFQRAAEVRRGPTLVMLGFLALVCVVLVGYLQYLRVQAKDAETRLAQVNQQLEAEKASLQKMKEALAQRTDPARVKAEIAALQVRAAEAQEIINQLERGDLGSLEGYGEHFITLARIGESGVWLTKVKIMNAGRSLELSGQSLQADAVLRYASTVNREFAGHGASITSLEMTPVENRLKNTAIFFKLF